MILWINGAFGSGKTQTAYELHRRISQSWVYDPEKLGFLLRSCLPPQFCKEDFQDLPLWRLLNYEVLKDLHRDYEGIVIVPMTLVDPGYFKEIIGRLREDSVTVRHFVLEASRDSLKKRLRSRGERKNSWAEKQIDRCLEGLADPVFEERIDTQNKGIDQVVQSIADSLGVVLEKDGRSIYKKKIDRIKIQWKHVRFLP